MSRQVVLVSGPPGAGKTTVAEPLAAALELPMLSKDVIKEQLYDSLWPGPGGADSWSSRLSTAAVDLLITLAGQLPGVVLEANFRPRSAEQRRRLQELDATLVEVFCRCPDDEAARRFGARSRTGERHAAHALSELDATLLAEFDRPVGLGTVIEVDTTAPVDIAALADAVRAELNGAARSPRSEP